MIAFEILVNGKRVCIAGASRVISADVHWTWRDPGRIGFGVSGIEIGDCGDGHVDWCMPSIAVGDEVTIRVVSADAIDPPRAPLDST